MTLPYLKSTAVIALLWFASVLPMTTARLLRGKEKTAMTQKMNEAHMKNSGGKKMTRREQIEARKTMMKSMSREELKAYIDETNLRKRKVKGMFRKRETSLSQILFPGVAPNDFSMDVTMEVLVDLVDSRKTHLPFEYYKLPVCKIDIKKRRTRKNLGQKLMGHNVAKPSPYVFKFGESTTCQTLCKVQLNGKEMFYLKRLIKRQYAVNLSLDGLPVYMYDSNGNAFRGSPIGSKLENDLTGEIEYYYHNHFRFTVLYSSGESGKSNEHRVVGFRVKPVSVVHTKDSCAGKKVINHKDTLLALKIPTGESSLDISYSYEVEWEQSEILWSDRWDVYLLGRPDESLAHHMSIINSFMVVIFLASVLSVILIKALRKDIAVYNDLAGDASEEEEETGWKLVHGDVFRPPSTSPMALSVMVGSGSQLVVSISCTLLLGLTKFLNPMQKGQALTNIVLLYVFTGTISGYVSARLFKFCGGKNWKLNTIYTATAFPGVLVFIFICLNLVLSFSGSAKSASIWTIISVFLLWICISTPLVCVGSYLGYRRGPISVPTRTNQIARVIPKQQITLSSPLTSFVIGGMPFSTVCIEVYFIMGAIWMHQYYYLMGYLFMGCVLLFTTCALLSTVLCYMRLCAEDHRWWWKTFFDSATAGVWLFMYSVWYLVTKLNLIGVLAKTVYLAYMAMASLAFGLVCGTVGFLTSFMFTRIIYSALKID